MSFMLKKLFYLIHNLLIEINFFVFLIFHL